jgi:mRNA interferase RelE/StbE
MKNEPEKLKVRYSRDAVKFLNKQTNETVKRIRKNINEKLRTKPPKGDVVQLEGYNDGRKRLRVGSWRIIFRYTEENKIEILEIIDIDSRGGIYK